MTLADVMGGPLARTDTLFQTAPANGVEHAERLQPHRFRLGRAATK
ncbi:MULTISPECIES: hypothetical protein [Deinococcus]|uniref:Uncharacterized protein n=1 Tax=Deinococcus rufus TaxID=2136097 RepID=A0ABV7Z874_9DEIO|nr:hypothetical protein [Deinococcus sp. AB2017081]WQE97187.1 hypothetical protein U2P90_19135 [Deinococcus sp. AB2017081]